MLTVTIALAQQSGLQFNFRNNGQGDVSFNVPSGSVITPPAGTNWKVASTQQPLNLPTGLKMNAGLVFTGNNNGLPVTSLTFTIGNKNGISITSFVAANFNGKSIFWGAHVWGPLKNGTTNTGWVGATPIAASVPEPEAPLLVGVGLLVGGLFRRHFWQV
jgi:hypothetical protein